MYPRTLSVKGSRFSDTQCHCFLSLSSADAKYYTKTMAAPNPKVWTDFLAVVMKVSYTCTLYTCTLVVCQTSYVYSLLMRANKLETAAVH